MDGVHFAGRVEWAGHRSGRRMVHEADNLMTLGQPDPEDEASLRHWEGRRSDEIGRRASTKQTAQGDQDREHRACGRRIFLRTGLVALMMGNFDRAIFHEIGSRRKVRLEMKALFALR